MLQDNYVEIEKTHFEFELILPCVSGTSILLLFFLFLYLNDICIPVFLYFLIFL